MIRRVTLDYLFSCTSDSNLFSVTDLPKLYIFWAFFAKWGFREEIMQHSVTAKSNVTETIAAKDNHRIVLPLCKLMFIQTMY